MEVWSFFFLNGWFVGFHVNLPGWNTALKRNREMIGILSFENGPWKSGTVLESIWPIHASNPLWKCNLTHLTGKKNNSKKNKSLSYQSHHKLALHDSNNVTSNPKYRVVTLRGTNISLRGKRNIIFFCAFKRGQDCFPKGVYNSNSCKQFLSHERLFVYSFQLYNKTSKHLKKKQQTSGTYPRPSISFLWGKFY